MMKRVWMQFIAPHPTLGGIARQRQAQLLASIAIFILIFQIVLLPITIGYYPETMLYYVLEIVIVAIVYAANRKGHYLFAAYLLVVSLFIVIHLSLINENYVFIFYAGFLFILSGVLLSLKVTLVLVFVSAVLEAIFLIYGPEAFIVERGDYFLFLLLTMPFVLTFVLYLLEAEKEQKAKLDAVVAAREEVEARWRSLVTAAPNMVALVRPDYTFSFINRLAEDVSAEMLSRKTILEVVHPDYREFAQKALDAAFQSAVPVQVELRAFDGQGQCHWYSVVANVVRNAKKEPRLLVMSHNISRQKESELQLIEERNLLRTLVDSIPDDIYIKNVEGAFILNNRTYLERLGVKNPEELIGKTAFDIYPPEIARGYRQNEEKALASKKAFLNCEEPIFDLENGVVGQALTSIIPARNSEGVATHIIGISRDITKQKQLEKQQLELSVHRERLKVLEEVIGDLSHDIKTPLASIKTAVYILQNHPEKRKEYLQKLDMQVNRLTKLVEDVLAIARLDKKGYFTFSTMRLSVLNHRIHELIKDFEMRLAEKHMRLDLNLDAREEFIVINDTELGRAIANLLENAINYTPDSGSIRIETEMREKEFIIRVSDTGMGVAEDEQELIFERFYRADKARSEAGTGLGLAITQRIVELHGGRIELDSVVGKGSVFSIYLPMLLDVQDEDG